MLKVVRSVKFFLRSSQINIISRVSDTDLKPKQDDWAVGTIN